MYNIHVIFNNGRHNDRFKKWTAEKFHMIEQETKNILPEHKFPDASSSFSKNDYGLFSSGYSKKIFMFLFKSSFTLVSILKLFSLRFLINNQVDSVNQMTLEPSPGHLIRTTELHKTAVRASWTQMCWQMWTN